MAANSGRNLKLQRSTDGGTTYTTIAGIRSKSVAVNNEPIDVTTDDSDAWRTLLTEPGNRTIDISFSGVTQDDTLRALVVAGTSSYVLEDAQILYPDGGTLECSWFLNGLTETGEYQDSVTFEGTLQSSGAPTFTAAV